MLYEVITVIYASFSGSGFVLKMKPVESWGAVPDFMGPSAPGKAVTLAEYLSDYPAYIPWTGEKGMPEAKGSARPAAIVITSYSIHYTKLYEMRQMRQKLPV